MKLLNKNLREGKVNILANNEEDLWYLSEIIQVDDIVKGKATRKIKVGGNQDKSIKRTFTATIKIKDINYEVSSLRLNGEIQQEWDDIPLGSHQSIIVEIGDNITIIKESWNKLDLQKLEEAEKEHFEYMLSVIDRDEATIAVLKKQGYQILAEIKGERKGKQYEGEVKDFFKEVIERINQYMERYKTKKLIIGCSAFWKEGIDKNLNDLKKNTLFVPFSNSGDKKEIENLLKEKGLASILESDRTSREITIVEEALVRISKNDKVSYGFKEVSQLSEMGAVDTLLVSEKSIKDAQEKGEFKAIEKLMKNVESSKGQVYIIRYSHDSGKKLHSLGGFIGILRWDV